jgi:hypothetical protein
VRLITLTLLLSSLYLALPAGAVDPAPTQNENEAKAATSGTQTDGRSAQPAPATAETAPRAPNDAARASSAAGPAVGAANGADAASARNAQKYAVDPVALKKAGYKLVNEDGQQLYCREDLKTGSHLQKTRTCLTERELAALKDNTRREIEYMRTRSAPPQGK